MSFGLLGDVARRAQAHLELQEGDPAWGDTMLTIADRWGLAFPNCLTVDVSCCSADPVAVHVTGSSAALLLQQHIPSSHELHVRGRCDDEPIEHDHSRLVTPEIGVVLTTGTQSVRAGPLSD